MQSERSTMAGIIMWLNRWINNAGTFTALGLLIVGTCDATPACVGATPTDVVRWTLAHHPDLMGADSQRYLSKALRTAIKSDVDRAKRESEICALCDGDIWTDSQEGAMRSKPSFELTQRAREADVTLHFQFSVAPDIQAESRSARVILKQENGCWKLDDLINQSGSIRQLLVAPPQ